MTFVTPLTGQVIEASHIAQLTGVLAGTTGMGQNIRLTQMTNASDYANIFGNVNTSNGYAVKIQYGDPATPNTLATFAKSVTQLVGGTATDATYGGNRGGIRVFDDGSVGLAGAIAKSPQNLFVASLSGDYADTTVGMHAALLELDSKSLVSNWDSAPVKIVARAGQSNAIQIAGVPGNNMSTLDLEMIAGTNNAVIAGQPSGTITGTSAVGRHTVSVGVATAHTQFDAAGAYADKVNGLYITSQGTGKFHASSTNGPNGIRANAAIYMHGPNGWEWLMYAVDVGGNRVTDALWVVDSAGNQGFGVIPVAKLHAKSSSGASTTFPTAIIEADNTSAAANQLRIRGKTTSTKSLSIGLNTNADYASIQADSNGTDLGLYLNPDGGVVGINTVSAASLLTIKQSAATSAGGIRLVAAGASDFQVIYVDNSGSLWIQSDNGAQLKLEDGSNLALGTSPSFGSGTGVFSITNASANPSTNPSGGGILYATGGAGTWRGSGGTVTTFGPAEPHCPTCERDFAWEWESAKYGYLAICAWCLTEALGNAGVMKKQPTARPGFDG